MCRNPIYWKVLLQAQSPVCTSVYCLLSEPVLNSKSSNTKTILTVNTIIFFNLITTSFCSMHKPSDKQPQIWFMSLTRKCSMEPASKFGGRMSGVCQSKMPRTSFFSRSVALQLRTLLPFPRNKDVVCRYDEREIRSSIYKAECILDVVFSAYWHMMTLHMYLVILELDMVCGSIALNH